MTKRYMMIVWLAACGAGGESADVDRPSEDCIERAPNAFRTRFEGAGFGSFETVTVEVMTSIGLTDGSSITCRAASRTAISGGEFVARADNRRDDAVYPRLGAFLDVDGNGACNAEVDLVWTRLSAAPPPEQEDTVVLTPELFALQPDADGCALLR